MKCLICSEDNLEGATYCEQCGGKLPAGTDEQPEAPLSEPPVGKYCETCGKPRPAGPPGGSEAPPSASPVQPVQIQGGMIRCSICERVNPATAEYCEDCGKALGEAQTSLENAEAPPSQHVSMAHPQESYSRLALVSGGKELALGRDVMIIGRRSPADGIYPDVDLTDDDPEAYISRRHGQVVKSGSQYAFEDLGSGNGSFINNARLTKGFRQILKDGDRLILGKIEMIFRA